MFSVRTTPKKFQNGNFVQKTHKTFSVCIALEQFENATIAGKLRAILSLVTGQFGSVFVEKLWQENTLKCIIVVK